MSSMTRAVAVGVLVNSGQAVATTAVEAKVASIPSVSSAEIDAFMKKVGSSLDEVKVASELTRYGKSIDDTDCTVIAHLIANGALASLEHLKLQGNQIGDAGMSALASACASGALAPGAKVFLGGNNATETGEMAMRDAAKARDLSVHF